MNINLITLNTKGRVDFDIEPDLTGYGSECIKDFDKVRVEGHIIDNGTEEYEVKLHITGTVVLESAINGSDVDYKLDIDYEDFVTNLVEKYKKNANSLDILPIIWENILLEIPIRVANKNDKFQSTEGDGWEVLDAE